MSIDRLGRNYEEILNQWNLLTENKRVNIIVIDMHFWIQDNALTG